MIRLGSSVRNVGLGLLGLLGTNCGSVNDTYETGSSDGGVPERVLDANGLKTTCYDSDHGIDLTSRGLTIGRQLVLKKWDIRADSCDNQGRIAEQYCNSQNGDSFAYYILSDCPENTICEDGACVISYDPDKPIQQLEGLIYFISTIPGYGVSALVDTLYNNPKILGLSAKEQEDLIRSRAFIGNENVTNYTIGVIQQNPGVYGNSANVNDLQNPKANVWDIGDVVILDTSLIADPSAVSTTRSSARTQSASRKNSGLQESRIPNYRVTLDEALGEVEELQTRTDLERGDLFIFIDQECYDPSSNPIGDPSCRDSSGFSTALVNLIKNPENAEFYRQYTSEEQRIKDGAFLMVNYDTSDDTNSDYLTTREIASRVGISERVLRQRAKEDYGMTRRDVKIELRHDPAYQKEHIRLSATQRLGAKEYGTLENSLRDYRLAGSAEDIRTTAVSGIYDSYKSQIENKIRQPTIGYRVESRRDQLHLAIGLLDRIEEEKKVIRERDYGRVASFVGRESGSRIHSYEVEKMRQRLEFYEGYEKAKEENSSLSIKTYLASVKSSVGISYGTACKWISEARKFKTEIPFGYNPTSRSESLDTAERLVAELDTRVQNPLTANCDIRTGEINNISDGSYRISENIPDRYIAANRESNNTARGLVAELDRRTELENSLTTAYDTRTGEIIPSPEREIYHTSFRS